MELSSLARLTHSRHFDTVKHGAEELAVPAGLILALATSLSARDLHEVREKQQTTTTVLEMWSMHRSPRSCLSGVRMFSGLEIGAHFYV